MIPSLVWPHHSRAPMAQTLQFLGRLCSGLATGERRSPARSRVQSPHHAPSASLTPPTSPRPPREDPRTLTHRAGTRGPSPSLGLGVRAGGARLTGAGSAMGSGGPTRCPVAPGYRQAKLQATPRHLPRGGLAPRSDPQAWPGRGARWNSRAPPPHSAPCGREERAPPILCGPGIWCKLDDQSWQCVGRVRGGTPRRKGCAVGEMQRQLQMEGEETCSLMRRRQ